MIEIVFNESLHGFLKFAKSRSKMLRDELGEIISIPLEMDIGTLCYGDLSEYRAKQIVSWFLDDPWLGEGLYYPKDYDAIKGTIKELQGRLFEGERARIWYDHCAYSICDFYYFISTLVPMEMNLSVVCLQEHPLLSLHYGGLDSIDNFAHLAELLSIERPLSFAERAEITERWKELSETDFPIRAYINGRLVGAPEDFYDSFIASCIPKDEDFWMLNVSQNVAISGIIHYYDIALWRISAVLKKNQYKYEKKVDTPLPIQGFLFHNAFQK